MQMDPRLNCEYERAYPRTQPYSRLPMTSAPKGLVGGLLPPESHTADAAGPAAQGRSDAAIPCVQKFDRMQAESPLSAGFCFWAGKRRASCLRECAGALFVFI